MEGTDPYLAMYHYDLPLWLSGNIPVEVLILYVLLKDLPLW